MYCDNCGAENRDSANFCHECRQSLSHIPAAKEAPAAVAAGPASAQPAIDESTMPDRLSRILSGRYELREMLGRGGMGVVYRAYDRQLGMDVAVKFLLDRYVDDFIAAESLKREARAAMRLAHPNIIRLYNFEHTAEAKYLLMEFIRGESLASIASRKPDRRFTESEVIKYVLEVCEALKYAHVENVIHRDIKPSNILVTPEGRVKLADFGVAFINEAVTGNMGGEIAGTPTYMSPEQILGQKLDGRSDIYSLGVTMYEMLAGRPPFRGGDVSYQHIHVMPEPVRGVSDWMNAIVLKCLRKEPEGRWCDAEEVKNVVAGKKDIGVAIQGKYQPEWVRVEVERKMGSPKTPPSHSCPEHIESPDRARAAVCKTPRPLNCSHVRERIDKIERHAGLAEHAPEREQARMRVGALAGIAGGVIILFIGRYARWSLSPGALLQLSWMIYGGLIGVAVGIAQRRKAKGLLSLTLGIMGGLAAGLLLSWMRGVPAFGSLRPPHYSLICGATIGAFLGMSDGIYERSIGYLVRCFLWGGLGGTMGIAVFLATRYAFSAFWSPLLNWVVIGAALGFFINISVGFAERPWVRDG